MIYVLLYILTIFGANWALQAFGMVPVAFAPDRRLAQGQRWLGELHLQKRFVVWQEVV